MDFTMVFFNEVLRYTNLKTTCFSFVLGSLQTCLKPAFFSPPSIYPNLIQLATIPKLSVIFRDPTEPCFGCIMGQKN